MLEVIASIAAATWLLTAVIAGVLERWLTVNAHEKQAIALLVSVALTVAALYTGWLTGDPVEVFVSMVAALFGANLIHDKIETPVRDSLS
ncbi:MAG: hypothetical protein RBS78_03440 [Coriobacteriia bacterium]|jgi:hypothetical protein|nr:hypothetical protein [Coriobacteriia bacterium]